MKRCPKCNRTFPDDNQKFCTVDGGLLRATDTLFDPNATIQSTSREVFGEQPDPGATVAGSSSAPTVVLPRDTGPTGSTTAGNFQQPPPERPATPPSPPPRPAEPQFGETVALPPRVPSAPLRAPSAPLPPVAAAAAVPPKKKSKLPLVLGILAILLVLGIVGVVAAFFLVIKPRLEPVNPERRVVVRETPAGNANTNANAQPSETPATETAEFVAPPGTTQFTNSAAKLDGKLAEHYLDFSFYYPDTWQADPRAGVPGASNFAKVERSLPPDFTQENFAVGWYESKGTYAEDKAIFPQLVAGLNSNLEKVFPEYRKVSEGPTKVNSLDGYEFRFESLSKGSAKGDIRLWGRIVFLPTGTAGDKNGATLSMIATSLAPELSGVDDVGAQGQMPVILESFRFAKKP